MGVTETNLTQKEPIMLDLHLILFIIGYLFSSNVESKTFLAEVNDDIINQEKLTNPPNSGYEENYTAKHQKGKRSKSATSVTETVTSKEGSILILGGSARFNVLSSVELLGSGDCTKLTLPFGRYGHVSGLTHDGIMLVCGGNDGKDLIKDCIHYNREKRKWQKHSTLPDGRHSASSVFTKTGT